MRAARAHRTQTQFRSHQNRTIVEYRASKAERHSSTTLHMSGIKAAWREGTVKVEIGSFSRI